MPRSWADVVARYVSRFGDCPDFRDIPDDTLPLMIELLDRAAGDGVYLDDATLRRALHVQPQSRSQIMFSPSGIASMVSTIAGELESVVGGVAGMLGAQPQVQTQIQEGIDGLKTTAAALATADAGASGQTLIARISSDANAVLAPLAALPLPSEVALVMRIAQIMVPTVMGVASIIWPPASVAVVATPTPPAAPAAPSAA